MYNALMAIGCLAFESQSVAEFRSPEWLLGRIRQISDGAIRYMNVEYTNEVAEAIGLTGKKLTGKKRKAK